MRATSIYVIHDGCQNEEPRIYNNVTNVFNDTHHGVAYCRNQGARLGEFDHLLFVDADDVLEPYFIEAMVKTKEKIGADIIYPNVLLWSSWHTEVKMKNAWHEAADTITLENMLEYNRIVVSSLVPRKLYFEVGGTPDLPILEDYALWMECIKKGATFAKSPQSVLRYRQREKSRLRNDEQKNEYYYRIRDNYESKKP